MNKKAKKILYTLGVLLVTIPIIIAGIGLIILYLYFLISNDTPLPARLIMIGSTCVIIGTILVNKFDKEVD